MSVILYILSFIYGTVFGSFYNVIIYRAPIDMSIVKGGSMCPNCRTRLKSIDLVPVFSWLFLRGKCRYCGSGISVRYPAVEILSGLLFVLAYHRYGLSIEILLYLALWSMLVITALIDFDYMIISDAVLLIFGLIGAVCVILVKMPLWDHLFGALAGFGVYFIVYAVAKLIYKREAFGFGDVLLMCTLGVFLGVRNTLLASFLAFYVAAFFIAVSKISELFTKKKPNTANNAAEKAKENKEENEEENEEDDKDTEELCRIKKEIPFGPSVCLSAFIVSLYGDKIVNIYLNMFI